MRRQNKGASAPEYALLIAGIAIISFSGLTVLNLGLDATGPIIDLGVRADAPPASPAPDRTPFAASCREYSDGDDNIVDDGTSPCHDLRLGADIFDARSATRDLTVTSEHGQGYGRIVTGDGHDIIISRQPGHISSGAGNDVVTLALPARSRYDIDLGPGDNRLDLNVSSPSRDAEMNSVRVGAGQSRIEASCAGHPVSLMPSQGAHLFFKGDCDISAAIDGTSRGSLSLSGISGLSAHLSNTSLMSLDIHGALSTSKEHSLHIHKARSLAADITLSSNGPVSLSFDGLSALGNHDITARVASFGGHFALSGPMQPHWDIFVDHGPKTGTISLRPDTVLEHVDPPVMTGRTDTLEILGCFDGLFSLSYSGARTPLPSCAKAALGPYDIADAEFLEFELSGQRRVLDLSDLDVDKLNLRP